MISDQFPLFDNHLCGNLKGPDRKQLAVKGIARMADTILNNHLGTIVKINEFYKVNLSKRRYNTLIGCIPEIWLNTINDNPWTFERGTTWGFENEFGLTTLTILNEPSDEEKLILRPFDPSTMKFKDTQFFVRNYVNKNK
jgi:hypothetical protein